MGVIELYPSIYCLYFEDMEGRTEMYLQRELLSDSNRLRIDLFESEKAAYKWINQEKEIMMQTNRESMSAFYERLTPHKLSLNEFSSLMRDNENLDSVTLVDENTLRRLYFRYEFEGNFHQFPQTNDEIVSKESIYVLSRQRSLDNQTILQKEFYFVTYPEIASPLISVGVESWADDLLSRKPNQGYYIEETTLHDIYLRIRLEEEDSGLFILLRDEGPHYIFRETDLKRIVESSAISE